MLLLLLLSVTILSVESVRFDITNLESGDVWVGILGNNGKPSMENGGFVLGPGQTVSLLYISSLRLYMKYLKYFYVVPFKCQQ